MSEKSRRIAVTGASGYVGTVLIRELVERKDVDGILAIDVREPRQDLGGKVSFVRQDVSEPFPGLFAEHEIDTAVHLAYLLRQGRNREANRRVNVGGTRNTIEACRRGDVERIVYLSSTSVYGAHPDSPQALTEQMPARPVAGFQYSEDKLASEGLLDEYASETTGAGVCILRCCPVMGANADNFIANAFDKPFLVAVSGASPPMQLIHEEDMVRCMTLATMGDAEGLYNLAGRGSISWDEMAGARGRRVVSLPAWLLYPLTQLTWSLRLQSDSPAMGLDMIRYPWSASTEKIEREMGFRPRYSSKDAWDAYVERRR
ncbi:MAG: NAD-dependent epimerase/dehydratase family protein [Dehalococcoidia bacterium]|nr:NAD-dependent epimerase/dehydratase family protein [Dehalococcoidia bacterium]